MGKRWDVEALVKQQNVGTQGVGTIICDGKSANFNVGQFSKVLGEWGNSDRMASFFNNSCVTSETTSVSMGVNFSAAMCGC